MKCPKCEGALNKVTIKTRPEYGTDILNDAEQTTEIEGCAGSCPRCRPGS